MQRGCCRIPSRPTGIGRRIHAKTTSALSPSAELPPSAGTASDRCEAEDASGAELSPDAADTYGDCLATDATGEAAALPGPAPRAAGDADPPTGVDVSVPGSPSPWPPGGRAHVSTGCSAGERGGVGLRGSGCAMDVARSAAASQPAAV